MVKLKLSYLIIMSALLCIGCVPVTAVSSVVVGTTIMDERTTGDVVEDAVISMRIKDIFLQTEVNEIFHKASISVNEGRVMLVGNIRDVYYKEKIEELVWRIRGVREVVNELIVLEGSVPQHAKDIFIKNTVRSKLLFAKDLRSVNYLVDVNNGVVYLLGIAQDFVELERAQRLSAGVKGVKKVISHVILKSDTRRDYNTYKKEY